MIFNQDFSCCAVQDIVGLVKNNQKLVAELRWPDKTFSEHLQSRTQKTTADIFDCYVTKVYDVLRVYPRLQVIIKFKGSLFHELSDEHLYSKCGAS